MSYSWQKNYVIYTLGHSWGRIHVLTTTAHKMPRSGHNCRIMSFPFIYIPSDITIWYLFSSSVNVFL